MRWVVKVTRYDRTYYYFRRKPWPEARIPGEPGSPEFETCYQSLLAASTAAETMPPKKMNFFNPRPRSESDLYAERIIPLLGDLGLAFFCPRISNKSFQNACFEFLNLIQNQVQFVFGFNVGLQKKWFFFSPPGPRSVAFSVSNAWLNF